MSRTLFSKNTPIVLLGNPNTLVCNTFFYESIGLDISCDDKPGYNIKIKCDKNHIFYNYVSQLHNYNYSFCEQIDLNNEMVDSFNCPYPSSNTCFTKPLLVTRVGDLVAAQLGVYGSNGSSFNNLYLLPELPNGAKDSIEQIVDILFIENDITEPEWASRIVIKGQKEIEEKIARNQNKISELRLANEALKKRNN